MRSSCQKPAIVVLPDQPPFCLIAADRTRQIDPRQPDPDAAMPPKISTPSSTARSTAPLSGEFALIARYFAPLAAGFPGADGLRDDVAVIAPAAGCELVLKSDAIVAGVDFPPEEAADLVARKALRVNLSDLAAKGAVPRAYLLDLILPETIGDDWIALFAAGLAQDQREYGVHLIGGDMSSTPGPVTIAVMAMGEAPAGRIVRRGGAKAGDQVFVSGTLGDAALGLGVLQGRLPAPDEAAAARRARPQADRTGERDDRRLGRPRRRSAPHLRGGRARRDGRGACPAAFYGGARDDRGRSRAPLGPPRGRRRLRDPLHRAAASGRRDRRAVARARAADHRDRPHDAPGRGRPARHRRRRRPPAHRTRLRGLDAFRPLRLSLGAPGAPRDCGAAPLCAIQPFAAPGGFRACHRQGRFPASPSSICRAFSPAPIAPS